MEEFVKFTGKTVEDALQEACIEFGTASENIEYRVIEHETRGFLGIGAKKAVIEARRKVAEENLEETIIDEVFRDNKPSKSENKKKNTEKEPKKKAPKAEEKISETKKTTKAEKSEKPEKTVKAEKPEKAEKAVKTETAEKAERPEKAAKAEKTEKTEKAEKSEKVREKADPQVVISRAEGFLSSVFDAMGMEVEIKPSFENDTLNVELAGDDMGVLIGKRGQTLDSLQYLTSLVVNKGKASYVRVKVDTEDYRQRRKATLENLAKNIAFKVKKTRRPVYLEPMNPYERRIIHSALQSDPYVTTHSEGEEPLRKVVVTLKKKDIYKGEEEEL